MQVCQQTKDCHFNLFLMMLEIFFQGLLQDLKLWQLELIGTGKITIKENNIDKVIDFNVPAENKITITGLG